MKPFIFGHNSIDCAYINVTVMLKWWKLETAMKNRLMYIDQAIKESLGFARMSEYLIPYYLENVYLTTLKILKLFIITYY